MKTHEESFDVPEYFTSDRKSLREYFSQRRNWNEWIKPIIGAILLAPIIYAVVYIYLAIVPFLLK